MTTPEVLIATGGIVIAGANALDQALPWGLVQLRPGWRMALVLLALIGLATVASGLYFMFHPGCTPGTWGCAAWDHTKWGE